MPLIVECRILSGDMRRGPAAHRLAADEETLRVAALAVSLRAAAITAR